MLQALAALLLAACTTRPPAPPTLPAPPADGPSAEAPAPATESSPASPAAEAGKPPAEEPAVAAVPLPIATLEDYKRAAAQKIMQASREHLFEGAPPPMLKSVVVLSIAVNAEGRIASLRVMRGNGHRSLERLAMQSVEAALPLPLPGRLAPRRGPMEFSETWLFRDDGRFQLRSLAEAQADASG
jgi:protein TonB